MGCSFTYKSIARILISPTALQYCEDRYLNKAPLETLVVRKYVRLAILGQLDQAQTTHSRQLGNK